MPGKRDLTRTLSNLNISKKDKDTLIPGTLGVLFNGVKTVQVANRAGFVWVRLRNNLSELIQAYNDVTSPVYGLQVLVARDEVDPSRYRVVEKDLAQYPTWGSTPYLPSHGNQHSFNPRGGGGGDVVFVFSQQVMMLLVRPSGTSGAPSVYIEESQFWHNGAWRAAGGTGTPDLTVAKPTNNQARMMLVYLDGNANPVISTGTLFSESLTGTSQVLPFVPSPPTGSIPLAGIRLVSGTSNLLWSNIYDLRRFIGVV